MQTAPRIRMFGGFSVEQGERVISRFRTRKTAAVLAYLALNLGKRLRREEIAAAVWPDSPAHAGLHSLRTAITSLRHQIELPERPILLVDRSSVMLPTEAVSTDVAEFLSALDDGDLDGALSLYAGPLLTGFFEEWVLPEQQRLESKMIDAAMRVAGRNMPADPSRVVYALEKASQADPYSETLVLMLIEAQVALGSKTGADKRLRDFEKLVVNELGGPPSAEFLRRAHDALAHDTPPPAQPRSSPASARPQKPQLRGALPQYLNRFFGREKDLSQIGDYIEAGVQCITILGPGGNGKTRLAVEAARRLGAGCPGGAHFISLSPFREKDDLEHAVRTSLGLKPARSSITTQLKELLDDAATLLVIDNAEQVLEAASALSEALVAALPNVTLLITSRIQPAIPGQRLLRLSPLPIGTDLEEEPPSVRLFVDRAQAHVADFSLSTRAGEEVLAICRLVEGIPLAIELAAAQVRNYSLSEIRHHLARRLDFLSSHSRRLPERHRSMRAVLEWSHDLLSEDLQAVFRRLSVFSGDPDAEAAEAVAGASREHLGDLVARSLLARVAASAHPRFHMLDLIREYAAEKLAGEEDLELRGRHRQHYLARASALAAQFGTPQEAAAYAQIDGDFSDLRSGLAASCESQPCEALRAATSLFPYWETRGLFRDGLRLIDWSMEKCADPDLRANAISVAGVLHTFLGDHDTAERLLEQACAAFAGTNDEEHGRVLSRLGNIYYLRGDYPQARERYEAARALVRDRRLLATIEHNLANVAVETGDFDRGEELYRSVLSVCESIGAERLRAASTNGLGTIALKRKDFESARKYLGAAMELYGQIGARHSVAHARQGLGHVELGSGRPAAALEHYLASYAFDRESGAKLNQADDLRGAALSYLRLGDFEQALRHVRQSCDLLLSLGYWLELVDSLAVLTQIQVARKRFKVAARVYGYAEALRRAHGAAVSAFEDEATDRAVETARRQLGSGDFDADASTGETYLAEAAEMVREAVIGYEP